MSSVRRQILLNLFKLFDLGLMMVAFVLASLPLQHRQAVSLAEFFSMRVKIANLLIFGLFALAWHFYFSVFGLYRSRRLSPQRIEIVDVIRATALGMVTILVGSMLFHIRMVTVSFVGLFWLISASTTVGSRTLMRATLARVRRRGHNLRQLLIVGSNSRALEFCREIESHPDLGYRIIGFVDQEWPGLGEVKLGGHPVISDFAGLPHFIRKNVVDEVVVALPMRSLYGDASRIAELCEEQGIAVRLLSNVFNLKLAKAKAEQWEGDPHITHGAGFVEGWPIIVKRTLDFTISLVVLVLISPVLLVTAILIKLTSPGPVFFMQNRIGLNKRRFRIFKFRTMVLDAEQKIGELEHMNEVSGPVFKIKNDPRITPIGKFLRKLSIDELPQLFNVLSGDMSLVGPRPLPVRDYEGFSKDWQRRRFSVRPGITCLWQIMGRSSIPFERWMELDLEYIDRWSLWLDLSILVRTIPAVFRGSGAA
jgi:exopolysaccharide biosynthesis polyprenyl glycosylphosphotransferase